MDARRSRSGTGGIALLILVLASGCSTPHDEARPEVSARPVAGCPVSEIEAVHVGRGDLGQTALGAGGLAVLEWCRYESDQDGHVTVETRRIDTDARFWEAAGRIRDQGLGAGKACDLVARLPEVFLVAESEDGPRMAARVPVDGCGSARDEWIRLLEESGYEVTGSQPVGE